ncbi:MAG: TolC family protein [Bacteroidales bacterium]|nr:TolC family protein [Bacteroidales bacterium]MBN2821487.1 TolC family protein [Bacteroidales bacterium]
MKFFSFFVIVFFGFLSPCYSQERVSLNIQDVIELAIMQSPSVKNAQNTNVNYYWRYRNYKTQNMPQLVLRGDIPDYSRTTKAVEQPDGSIKFVPTELGQMSSTLSLNQAIGLTGTTVYASSSLFRVQNYKDGTIEYSGEPFLIGFYQPLFQYNWMKWSRKTEPLVYEEAQKDLIETIEEISLWSVQRFFNYLKIQTDYKLAENSLKNSEDNLRIAETKIKLGRISENDYQRIKLSVYNSRKALNTARMELKNADFELKSFIGMDQSQQIEPVLPMNVKFFEVDVEKAVNEAHTNRKETPRFERRLVEAERDLERAKRSTGVSAAISGNYGVSNNAEMAGDVYTDPEQSQRIKLSLSVPILDWGRSASTVKLAESQYDLVVYDVEKDKEDFERRVVMQVEQFGLLEEQLITSSEADVVAENGYQIAQKKFQNGEISITDLNIFLQERESARRDYIRTLESYWKAYYNLRILTLYDFEADQKISYGNPMIQMELERRGISH